MPEGSNRSESPSRAHPPNGGVEQVSGAKSGPILPLPEPYSEDPLAIRPDLRRSQLTTPHEQADPELIGDRPVPDVFLIRLAQRVPDLLHDSARLRRGGPIAGMSGASRVECAACFCV